MHIEPVDCVHVYTHNRLRAIPSEYESAIKSPTRSNAILYILSLHKKT